MGGLSREEEAVQQQRGKIWSCLMGDELFSLLTESLFVLHGFKSAVQEENAFMWRNIWKFQ